MSDFNFRLQKVLDLRHWKEQEQAGHLSRARHEEKEAAQALEDLNLVRASTRTQISHAHGAGGTVGHLQNLQLVLRQIDRQIAAATQRRETAEAQVRTSLSDFTEAYRERSILENLKERQAEESRLAALDLEQKTLDEIALTRHTRPASDGREDGS